MLATIDDFKKMLVLPPRDTYIGRPDGIINMGALSFYLLSVQRSDGKIAVSRYDWRLSRRSLPQLIELAKLIGAKPLYAVRVKMKVR